MHQLHIELDENERLQEVVAGLVERIGDSRLRTGLILDFNPFWLSSWGLDSCGFGPDAWPWWAEGPWASSFPGVRDSLHFASLPDLTRRFRRASMATREYFGRDYEVAGTDFHFDPYLLRVVTRPDAIAAGAEGSIERGLADERQRIISAARECVIPTIVETRPEPILVVQPGSGVAGNGGQGTLGGFVTESSTGSVWGMTCGHVASAGVVSTQAGKGTVVSARAPVAMPAGAVCSSGCAHSNDLDVCLVDGVIGVNRATRVASVVTSGQLVEMDSAGSGRQYQIGGAVVDHLIGGGCWERLIQFHAPTVGILPVAAQVAMTPVPQGGDSGAWLLRNKIEWAGMVVASDHLHGYALAGDHLLARTAAEFGLSAIDLA